MNMPLVHLKSKALHEALLLFFVLVPFFAFQEISRVLGENKLYYLFFVKGAEALVDRTAATERLEVC